LKEEPGESYALLSGSENDGVTKLLSFTKKPTTTDNSFSCGEKPGKIDKQQHINYPHYNLKSLTLTNAVATT
jgi:hypothetical protein